jgi:hypothetical protein
LRLIAAADRLLQKVVAGLDRGEPSRPSTRVVAQLLSRVANDLRIIGLTAERGYAARAMTIASAAYELAQTAAFVGSSDERATVWLQWNRPEKTPWTRDDVRDDIRTRLAAREEVSKGKDRDFHYMLVCCAKHGNPLFEAKYGLVSSPDAFFLSADPDITPRTERHCRLAIWSAVRAAWLSLAILRNDQFLTRDDERTHEHLAPALLRLEKLVRDRDRQ